MNKKQNTIQDAIEFAETASSPATAKKVTQKIVDILSGFKGGIVNNGGRIFKYLDVVSPEASERLAGEFGRLANIMYCQPDVFHLLAVGPEFEGLDPNRITLSEYGKFAKAKGIKIDKFVIARLAKYYLEKKEYIKAAISWMLGRSAAAREEFFLMAEFFQTIPEETGEKVLPIKIVENLNNFWENYGDMLSPNLDKIFESKLEAVPGSWPILAAVTGLDMAELGKEYPHPEKLFFRDAMIAWYLIQKKDEWANLISPPVKEILKMSLSGLLVFTPSFKLIPFLLQKRLGASKYFPFVAAIDESADVTASVLEKDAAYQLFKLLGA